MNSMTDTANLLQLARKGDRQALESLFDRYLPEIRRWASGRLPAWARDLAETQDVVQDTLLQVFKRLDGFDYRGDGAFLAYLKQAVMNRLRNEMRRASRRPGHDEILPTVEDAAPSPVEFAVGVETLERYERALGRLPAAEREAVVARVELGLSWTDLAERLGKPSSDAARMMVARALLRVADEMALTDGRED